MLGAGHELEQVDHVHKPDFDVRQVLSEQSCGSQRLHCWDIAATCHYHVGFGALVVAGPDPDASSLRAVLDCRLHVQVLEVHLFVGDNNVHVVDASQTMVRDGEQAVCVGRQVNANNARTFVDYHIEETGILVGKPVMILPPDQRSDQQVQG